MRKRHTFPLLLLPAHIIVFLLTILRSKHSSLHTCQAAVLFLESRRVAVWSLQSPRLHRISDWRTHHYHRSRLCCSHRCLTLKCSTVLAQLPKMSGRLTWLNFRWSEISSSQCMSGWTFSVRHEQHGVKVAYLGSFVVWGKRQVRA